ncbi:hypothetical protein ACFX1X_044156 [Malus domestica]
MRMSHLANCGLFDDALDAKQGLGFRMKEIWEWVLEMGEIKEVGRLGIGVECKGIEKEAMDDSSVITASRSGVLHGCRCSFPIPTLVHGAHA